MLILLLAAAAFADSTLTCEATDGSGLVHETWSRTGGTPPPDDVVVSRMEWRVGDVVLVAVEQTAGAVKHPPKRPERLPVEWEWNYAKNVVLEQASDDETGRNVYTTEVTLRSKRALAPTIPEKERTFPMTCTATRARVP